jgi:hypothetical protein
MYVAGDRFRGTLATRVTFASRNLGSRVMLRIFRSLLIFAEQLAIMDEVASAVRRVVLFACTMIFASFLVLAGVACALVSLWVWADERFGPVQAPLLVAAVLVAAALLIAAIGMISQRMSRRSRAARMSHAVQDLALAPRRLLATAAEGFLNGLATGSKRP